ncbi:hypothetical protein Tco_0885093 [Tanacetum coccineum]
MVCNGRPWYRASWEAIGVFVAAEIQRKEPKELSLMQSPSRMKVFPLSLADYAKEWWISEEITPWEELVEKFFCRFYLESYDGEDEMLDEGEN